MPEKTSRAASAAPRFQCVEARAPDLDAAERTLAEALGAGASGAEQRESEDGVTLLLYAPDAVAEAVRAAAARVVGADAVAVRDVPEQDWSESWKDGLRAVDVSARLRIRPSFDASPPRPGQRDLVIDPGQAFGTGGHESTRLALEGLDALRATLPGSRVLDVGTGSGVLALAARALGAERVVGFDLDPLAAPAARDNAAVNGEAEGIAVFTGPLDALAPGLRFDGIVANLLRRELEPLLFALGQRVGEGGWLVFAGLLADEVDAFRARCADAGIAPERSLRRRDASGVSWSALVMRRRGDARG